MFEQTQGRVLRRRGGINIWGYRQVFLAALSDFVITGRATRIPTLCDPVQRHPAPHPDVVVALAPCPAHEANANPGGMVSDEL
jgi:hypothetical protein